MRIRGHVKRVLRNLIPKTALLSPLIEVDGYLKARRFVK